MTHSRAIGATALLLVVAACGGSAGPPSSASSADLVLVAAQFAASADRALERTSFEAVGPEGISDLVVGLCEGLGVGAIPATIDGLDVDAPPADREILTEVLRTGILQVCPDRAPVDLTGFYVDAVSAAAEAGDAGGAFDEGDVIRAGPVACNYLRSGSGVEAALLAVVASLFGLQATTIDGLIPLIGVDQGLVSGAVLASATAVLCPEFASEVEAFMESL